MKESPCLEFRHRDKSGLALDWIGDYKAVMQIIDLLAEPSLWQRPQTFDSLIDQSIHGDPMGKTPAEIRTALQKHFSVSKNLRSETRSEVVQILDQVQELIGPHFNMTGIQILIAGIDDSEEFANKNLGGVSGYAWPKTIFLYFNPKRDWQKLFLQTAIHEINHCLRYVHSDPYVSFFDWCIFEGLAESFQFELTGESIDMLQLRDQALPFLPQLKLFWNEMPQDAGDWFFGNQARGIPMGLGYIVGHYLVEKFRKANPSIGWQDLIRLPSKTFAD